MKAAVLSVKCLENEGVECMFGDPGDKNVDILDANLESPIRFITRRHEQSAALMADIYGRLTGNAKVSLSTLGRLGVEVKELVSFGHPYKQSGTT